MTRQSRIVVCPLVLLLAACAGAPPVAVPDKLKAGGGEALAMIVAAKGVQIYECRAGKDAVAGYEWAFVAPEAELFDSRGNPIGRHGAGPQWQAADGSTVRGVVRERANAPNAAAIPWLLLGAKNVGQEGLFSKVTSIQRLNTVGGVAHAAPCTRDTAATQVRVDYTADYYFYTGR